MWIVAERGQGRYGNVERWVAVQMWTGKFRYLNRRPVVGLDTLYSETWWSKGRGNCGEMLSGIQFQWARPKSKD